MSEKPEDTWGEDFRVVGSGISAFFKRFGTPLLILLGVGILVVFLLSLLPQNGAAPLEEPTETPTSSPSATVTPTPSPTPTETPALPEVSSHVRLNTPGAWEPTSLDGCREAWEASTEGISSVLVKSRAEEAFKEANFSVGSNLQEDSLTVTGTGDSDTFTKGVLIFTLDSMTLCFT